VKIRSEKWEMRNENWKLGNRKVLIFSYFLFLLILISCGKKGEPTLKSYEKPDPPSNLRAIHRESEIILLWDFPKNKEKSIRGFYLMKLKGADFERIFLEADKRSHIDREFTTGSQYAYKIISQNLRGILSNNSNVIEIEPRALLLPPGKLVYKIEYDLLTLTWEDIGNGIFYNIYKSDQKGMYSVYPLNAEPVKGTSFRDRFDINKTVYYTIRSLWGGTVRDEGPPSEELEVNPSEFIPSPPEGLRALTRQDGVQLLWHEAPETWVTGYKVYRETDKKEGFIFIGETSVPAYFDKGKPSKKRSYRVTALGPSKEGPASEINDVVLVPLR
jgi:fibronectin type 3 domain-containing protein